MKKIPFFFPLCLGAGIMALSVRYDLKKVNISEPSIVELTNQYQKSAIIAFSFAALIIIGAISIKTT